MIALTRPLRNKEAPLYPTKEAGDGSETPPPPTHRIHPEPLLTPRGGTVYVQPQSIPASCPAILCQSFWRRGRALSPLTSVSPVLLTFLFIFLMHCFFPCIRDLSLTLWANLLATDEFPSNTNCVVRGTFFPTPADAHLSALQQNLAGYRRQWNSDSSPPATASLWDLPTLLNPGLPSHSPTLPLPRWPCCPHHTLLLHLWGRLSSVLGSSQPHHRHS